MRQTGPTVAEEAAHYGMSERWVKMVRAVERLKPELVPEILNGNLTANMALQWARNEPSPMPGDTSKWLRLVKAWNACDEYERQRLVDEFEIWQNK